MITPTQIRQKALKLWESGKVLRAALLDEPLFPWVITFRKPNAREQLEDFAAIRTWMGLLKKHSGEGRYQIAYKILSHRQLGEQRLPDQIYFETQTDLLKFIQKQREFKQLYDTARLSIERHPALKTWLCDKPRVFMKHHADWQGLLNVCEAFIANPQPNCYLRELEIVGIDSKFIEHRKGILTELLDILLPATAIQTDIIGSKQYGFERRYGLKYPEPLIRLRLLDPALQAVANLSDVSLPLSQFATWSIDCDYVFITENKINGLSFPKHARSIVIFGLGYGVDSLAAVPWLQEKAVFYWGDIDTHGFSILSRLRHHLPEVQSLMMNQATLQRFSKLTVIEPENARCTHPLSHLNPMEQTVYHALQQSQRRLEQERLPMNYVLQQLETL